MDTVTRQVLDGTFKDPFNVSKRPTFHKNGLCFPYISAIGVAPGLLQRGGVTPINATQGWNGTQKYVIFTSAMSGAFACVLEIPPNNTEANPLIPTHQSLCKPNNIGLPPAPTLDAMIPSDSMRVIVGCGHTPSGNCIVREQFWQLQAESYCLAAGEKKTVSQTITTGMQRTSSELKVVAESIGVSVSGGWGPVSASATASLSASSTSFQQISLTTEVSTFEQTVLENTAPVSRMFLKWQLMDVITVYSKDHFTPLGSIVSALKPVLVTGPWELPRSDRFESAKLAQSAVGEWPANQEQLSKLVR